MDLEQTLARSGDGAFVIGADGRILLWNFPKPKGGGIAVVTYPFVFKQAGE